MAICHFCHFVEGRDFTAFMDHKPLTFAFAKATQLWSAHQQCHLTAISEYTMCIKHITRKNNIMADTLSWAIIHTILPDTDYDTMSAVQKKDTKLAAFCTTNLGLMLEDIVFGPTGTMLLCDISTGQPQPLVPTFFCQKVFDALHNLTHPSICATQFVW